MIRDMPVFGTGLGAFDQAYPLYRRPGTLVKITKPHQLPLGLWAEMGLGGLLAELALAGAIAVTFVRRRPDGWTDLEALAAAGVAALLTQTLFQYYLYFEYPWLYLALSVVAVRLARTGERAGS
jgi:O-antigen ligase